MLQIFSPSGLATFHFLYHLFLYCYAKVLLFSCSPIYQSLITSGFQKASHYTYILENSLHVVFWYLHSSSFYTHPLIHLEFNVLYYVKYGSNIIFLTMLIWLSWVIYLRSTSFHVPINSWASSGHINFSWKTMTIKFWCIWALQAESHLNISHNCFYFW